MTDPSKLRLKTFRARGALVHPQQVPFKSPFAHGVHSYIPTFAHGVRSYPFGSALSLGANPKKGVESAQPGRSRFFYELYFSAIRERVE